jgi:hypothetical protein
MKNKMQQRHFIGSDFKKYLKKGGVTVSQKTTGTSKLLLFTIILALVFAFLAAFAMVTSDEAEAADCSGRRTVTADVVALDQPFYYNRLGAINANGMMYALARDVVTTEVVGSNPSGTVVADVPFGSRNGLQGKVMLREDKRPRPIVLRMNETDCLAINFTNLLDPNMFIFNLPGDFPTGQILGLGVPINPAIDDQPLTRVASIHVDGLNLVGNISSDGSNVGKNGAAGNGLVAPGLSTTYTYYAEHETTHLMYSMGSTVGGEGVGGTRAFGLFGAVNVQKAGAEWYRSQLTRQEMDWATQGYPGPLTLTAQGHPVLDYNAVYPAGTGGGKDGLPIIAMLCPAGLTACSENEIVHSDINAIITGPSRGNFPAGTYNPNQAAGDPPGATDSVRNEPYREFTVIFHDEAFGVQAFPAFYNDPVLGHTTHSVRDSFPINYGSGGIGSEIIANRLGVGPMWDCAECKYEEFFLASSTVGDPAMIVDIPANFGIDQTPMQVGPKATKALYPDDPSNVHHSYLNDRVKFRNLHAGPKEHHIFHLHAHQWLFNPDDPQSNYLDGQAIGPGSGYTYEIAYGGSGNRNKTAGDSIFHCHFYPHFAQGMWELWRVHDVFEQGTAMVIDTADNLPIPAAGSRALPDGEIAAGTPIPGLVPIPTNAMAPMPDAAATVVAYDLNPNVLTDQDGDGNAESPFDSSQFDANGDGIADIEQSYAAFDTDSNPLTGTPIDTNGDGTPDFGIDFKNPGYPWFIPTLAGHRPTTPPLDLADVDGDGNIDDGGLPRHVVASGPDEFTNAVEQYQTRLDFNKVLHKAAAVQIPEGGTATEQVAMAFHAQRFWLSFKPDGAMAAFETNGLPPVPGAPYADPCRTDSGGPIPVNRTIKGANIEMDIVLNKVGWHFQQQRFEALWGDVNDYLTGARAPEPLIMRMNSTECGEYFHTNLVPNVYQLDDYQVRTPTDIIGQHIHLVKFDVTSADGSANGWNYEDGTLSPDEVRERIDAFNHGGGLTDLAGNIRKDGQNPLTAVPHPFFGVNSPIPGQNWLGARTTVQRWYADPLLERSWDGGVGTVFTHDHYGPSTHQQVGLYSTLLVEPEGSKWFHNETGVELGKRTISDGTKDGGPTTWQAIIKVPPALWTDLDGDGDADDPSHREFYFEYGDFQHAYERGGGVLNPNFVDPDSGATVPSYADFDDAINPSFRQEPPNLADLFLFPNACPGPLAGQVNLPRPCPEAISADDPGTYVLNFRNEPIGLRVFNGNNGQANGDRGDLALAFQSREDRAIGELNVQPETNGISPYPPLTADVRPGDPWTPMMRAYMGDRVRIRTQVGAHEEEHNFSIHGLKWRFAGNSPNSGWRNSAFQTIDEYFNLDIPVVPDTGPGNPNNVDYLYTVGAEVEGYWNGVWGILRTYSKEQRDDQGLLTLAELSNNDIGPNAAVITNADAFNGICPNTAPLKHFNITAVRAVDVLGPNGIVYNTRTTSLTGGGQGPLIDPTAILYVRNEDLVFRRQVPVGLQPGVPVEPLILRVNAGDCIEVQLTNALPADLSGTEMDGFNAMAPIIHKRHDRRRGITTFNANDLTPSSLVGLHPQLLAYDVRDSDGFATGTNSGDELVAPGEDEMYTWYAGDVSATNVGPGQYRLTATPVEFGATGLMPADKIKGTENGMIGALIVEPQDATWDEDPSGPGIDTRAQATVTIGSSSFREFVVVLQNDVNLRYGGGDCDPAGRRSQIDDIECAVANIAAEGPGVPEDPQDSGQKAINYGAEPLWFRLGIAPNTPFNAISRSNALKDLIPQVFANNLPGVDGDPQTPVYTATEGQEVRMRVVLPGGHARGITYTVHGHEWQRQPYVNGSTEIGDNPDSQYYGTQEGVNPAGHWDFLIEEAGGPSPHVTGDYLWRDQASFGSFQGLWGLMRVNPNP